MREQVITPRATGRGAQSSKASAGGMVQRPARRARGSATARPGDASVLRKALSYFPLVGKITLAVVTGLLVFAGYRAAASASFFQARSIEVNHTSRASADEIRTLVRRAVAESGVWRADLDGISKELQRLPWVKSAVVSRVLPDGLRVRVTERVPRAVVRTSAGRLVWVDTDAVVLGAMSPTDQMPPFFIRGLEEAETGSARAANRERMQAYEEMRNEWERLGLSERVSEVNLDDLRDVRAQLAGDDSQIEVRLGREDFGNRLKRSLEELDNQRNTPRGPFIMYIDASQGVAKGSHLVVGLRPDAQLPGASESASSPGDAEIVKAKANERPAPKDKTDNRERAAARKEDAERRKKEREAKNKQAEKAKGETRPRRVG